MRSGFGSMWAVLAGLLATSLLRTAHGQTGRQCPKPVLPADAQLSPAGVDVNLTCLPETWEDNITVTWKLENRTLGLKHPNRVVSGGRLLLKSVRHRDSGNYTCYRGGLKVRNIRLLVGALETLETPTITCTRKSPVRHIRCEWQPSNRPSPATKAVLLVRKGFSSKETSTQPCTYYHSSQRFICQFKIGEGDHTTYVVFMCVTSISDSQVSKQEIFSGDSIIQPDPPPNVTVRAVARAPKKLNVTWQYPPTWNPTFYKLQFEVQYRVEHSTSYSTAHIKLKTSYLIVDALMGRKHVVHVRAQEEFSHGSWSRWSLEAAGVPWIDPELLEVELLQTSLPADYSTEDVSSYSAEDYNYKGAVYAKGSSLSSAHPNYRGSLSVQTATNRTPMDTPVDSGHLHIPPYTFFIAGVSLALGIILFVGIMMRYKKKWQHELKKGEKMKFIFPFCPLSKLANEESKTPSNNIPLVSPPSSPISDGPTDDYEDPVLPATYDVTNLNYFFLAR